MPSKKRTFKRFIEHEEIPKPVKIEPKEDGEVSSDDSADTLPNCHLNSSKSCSWGQSCTTTALGNYDMFKPQLLPPLPLATKLEEKLPPTVASWPFMYGNQSRRQPNDSFDRSLQELKQLMRSADYNQGQRNIEFVKPKSTLELNDLDTDPYYTNKPNLPDPVDNTPKTLCTPWMLNPNRIVRFQCVISASSSSSSSSSDDFTSTTDSSTSSPSPRSKRCSCKQQRRLLSSSSSDSDELLDYSSTTPSSVDLPRSRKFAYKPKKKKISQRRRKYLQKKLREVNRMIARIKRLRRRSQINFK